MSKPPLILCMSVANARYGTIAFGSVRVPCSVCIQECWKAPSTAGHLLKYPNALIVCDECFAGEVGEEKLIEVPLPNEEQLAEMRELGFDSRRFRRETEGGYEG